MREIKRRGKFSRLFVLLLLLIINSREILFGTAMPAPGSNLCVCVFVCLHLSLIVFECVCLCICICICIYGKGLCCLSTAQQQRKTRTTPSQHNSALAHIIHKVAISKIKKKKSFNICVTSSRTPPPPPQPLTTTRAHTQTICFSSRRPPHDTTQFASKLIKKKNNEKNAPKSTQQNGRYLKIIFLYYKIICTHRKRSEIIFVVASHQLGCWERLQSNPQCHCHDETTTLEQFVVFFRGGARAR